MHLCIGYRESLNHFDLDRKELFDRTMASLEVPRHNTKEAAWEQLQMKLVDKKDPQVIPMRSKTAFRWVAAAAVVALVGVLGYLFVPTAETLVVSGSRTATEVSSVELPDGSVAMVTPETQLSWSISDNRREIVLQGEAFFDVVSGAPFEVTTAAGKVEVLGTSFSVYTNEQAFAVECVSGSVRVSDADVQTTITAGQGVKRRNGALASPYEHGMTGPQWVLDAEVSYTNADLHRVVRHVMQRFNILVRLENVGVEKEFSGTFEMVDPTSTLQIIAKAMALELEVESPTSYVLFERD